MNNKRAFRFSLFGAASAIVGALLFLFVPFSQYIGPGMALGFAIGAAQKCEDKEAFASKQDILLILVLASLGWYLSASAGSNLFIVIIQFLKAHEISVDTYLLIAISGFVAGVIGSFFVVLSVNRIYKIKIVRELVFKPALIGGLIGASILPFVVANEYIYIVLFLPWQTTVIYTIIVKYESQI